MIQLMMQNAEDAMKRQFVGDRVFSGDELAEMFDLMGQILRNYENGGCAMSDKYDDAVFVLLVNAVKDWNSDESGFWECIFKKIVGTTGSQKIYQYFCGVIDRLARREKMLSFFACQKKYYATILAHAFAPISSTESFLDLCWDIYSQDMDFEYSKQDEIFLLVAKELRRIFSSEKTLEEDIKLGSKVYFLRAGIKQLAIEKTAEAADLIDRTICLLDRMFDTGLPSDGDSYFDDIAWDWWKKKEKEFGIRPKRKSAVRAITDYSKIRPKFNFNGEKVVLTLPCIRLKDNVRTCPILNIFRNGALEKQREMETFGTGITMATKEVELDVDELVSQDGNIDFEIKIDHCGEILYDSKKTLFREFLIFKDKREMTRDECHPGNYTLFALQFDGFSAYPENIRRKPGEQNLYVFNASEGELLQHEKRTILFVSENQDRPIKILANKKNNAKFVHNGEEYDVIDGDLKVVVKADVDASKYGIRYEDESFRLIDFADGNESGNAFSITKLLNVCEPQKIAIFNYAANKIEAACNVVKFHDVNIVFDKPLYFDKNSNGYVRFLTRKYDKTVEFDIAQGDVIVPFENGDIVLSPPVLRWQIDDGEASTRFADGLWYKIISNSAMLHVEMPPELSYCVIDSQNRYLTEGTDLNSFKFGATLYSSLQQAEKLSVYVKIENHDIVPLFCAYLKEKFIRTPYEFAEKSFVWNSEKAFIGDEDAHFRVTISCDNKVMCRLDDVKNGSAVYPLQNLDIGYYDVAVELKKNVAFRQTFETLEEKEVIFGDVNKIRFHDKYLKISRVMLTDASDYRSIKPFYVDELKYMGNIDGCHYYIGNVFIFSRFDQKVYLNTMKNDKGLDEITNPIRLELRNENSCFIVAGVDADDMNDFLGEFTLDYSRNQISNINDSRHAKGIDYYIFEKKEEHRA